MNNITKVSLTIEVEGRTLVRKSDVEVISTIFKKFPAKKLKNGKEIPERVKKIDITHNSLMSKPAKVHVNLNMEAYNYMISPECPYWAKPKKWVNMDKIARLEAHLQRICEHTRGKSFTYEILED